MEHYLGQISPETDWRDARISLWRSVEVLGEKGSKEKEEASKNWILRQ
jgi:hypothetical protein